MRGGVFLGVYFGVKTPKKGITPIAPPDGPVIVAPPSEGEDPEDPEDNVDWDAYCERNFELTPSTDGTYYILSRAKVNDLEDLVVPATYKGVPITTIAGHAFENHTEMVSLKTPECINEMGMEAFLNCSALKEVTMEKYPQKMNIHPYDGFQEREDAFFGCTSIETLTINSGVVGNAFMAAQMYSNSISDLSDFSASLKNVILGNGVTELGYTAFAFSLGLTSISIPESVTKIDIGAFTICMSLTSITIPGSVKTICQDAFAECVSLAFVTFEEGVEKIETTAFRDCSSLTEISLPSTIKAIESDEWSGVFSDCENLQTINFANGIDWANISIGSGIFSSNQTINFVVYVDDMSLQSLVESKLNRLNCNKTIDVQLKA